jgi:hypothetical protein
MSKAVARIVSSKVCSRRTEATYKLRNTPRAADLWLLQGHYVDLQQRVFR